MGLTVVYLGEHYLVDLVAGAALEEAVRAAAPRAAPAVRTLSRGLERLRMLAAA